KYPPITIVVILWIWIFAQSVIMFNTCHSAVGIKAHGSICPTVKKEGLIGIIHQNLREAVDLVAGIRGGNVRIIGKCWNAGKNCRQGLYGLFPIGKSICKDQ